MNFYRHFMWRFFVKKISCVAGLFCFTIKSEMKVFTKILLVVLCAVPYGAGARDVVSRAARVTNTPTSGYTYNYMYPYLNNQMRNTLNPGDANAQSTSPINVIVKTEPMSNSNTNMRRVVSRAARGSASGVARSVAGGGNSARVASMGYNMGGTNSTTVSRMGTTGVNSGRGVAATNRRVVSRAGTSRGGVARSTTTNTTINTMTADSIYVSSSQCLAGYTECMNNYCVRQDTPYNRCFCSSKLSQIESNYQPKIDRLVKQILVAKRSGDWTDAEMAEYWNDKIGQYVGENTWEKLDDALNIEWPDAELRMSGQNAYLTGHQYCVQYLKNCAYAVPSMRDVYRSEIARDCDAYEKSLDWLKTSLETVLATYQD